MSGEGTSLPIDRQLVPLTMGLMGGEVVCDLSMLEEDQVRDVVTVVTDQQGQVSSKRQKMDVLLNMRRFRCRASGGL